MNFSIILGEKYEKKFTPKVFLFYFLIDFPPIAQGNPDLTIRVLRNYKSITGEYLAEFFSGCDKEVWGKKLKVWGSTLD